MSPRGGRRKGAGRKPKPEAERRTKTVSIRLTEDEAAQLRELSGELTSSAYVQNVVVRHLRRMRR